MKENQRIRLTKKMLKDSLLMLLSSDSIHTITVSEICSNAEINRTTFYKYYGSQYDLLKEMEDDALSKIESYWSVGSVTPNDSLDRLKRTVRFMDDNLELCRILFNNNIDPEFPTRVISLPWVQQTVDQLTSGQLGGEMAYTFNFIVDGVFGIIRRWMNKDQRESPEEIALILNQTIKRIIRE